MCNAHWTQEFVLDVAVNKVPQMHWQPTQGHAKAKDLRSLECATEPVVLSPDMAAFGSGTDGCTQQRPWLGQWLLRR